MFENDTVWNSVKTMRPEEWWQMCGGSIPVLRKVAVRALSSPTSAGPGERNWSTYGFVVGSPTPLRQAAKLGAIPDCRHRE